MHRLRSSARSPERLTPAGRDARRHGGKTGRLPEEADTSQMPVRRWRLLSLPLLTSSAPTGLLAGLGLVIGVFLAYAGSLGAPFVYDDTLAIPENPTIRQFWPLTAILLPQAEGGLTVSGRPILNLSFAINYAISGTEVWSYHVFNLLVHAGSALLLFRIVRRTTELRNAFAPAPAGPMVETGFGGGSVSRNPFLWDLRSLPCGRCIHCSPRP